MANFKPGDFAVIIVSMTGVNLGKLVRVIDYFGDAGEVREHGGIKWTAAENNTLLIESLCSPLKYLSGLECQSGPTPASFLRPVSGIPDVDMVETADKEMAR